MCHGKTEIVPDRDGSDPYQVGATAPCWQPLRLHLPLGNGTEILAAVWLQGTGRQVANEPPVIASPVPLGQGRGSHFLWSGGDSSLSP